MGKGVKHYLKDGTTWNGNYIKCQMENFIPIKLIPKTVNLYFILAT
jgi:hypothetical protein